MTLRPFISVVSYSLSSVFLLLVLFSLDLPNFPHVEFSLLIPFSSSPDMMGFFLFVFFRHEDVSSWLAGGNVMLA